MFESRFRDPWIFPWNDRSASFLQVVIAYLVWGIPYLMPTPTRGSALIIFFTVAWSENANRIEAVDKKVLKCELLARESSFENMLTSIIRTMNKKERDRISFLFQKPILQFDTFICIKILIRVIV